MEPEAITALLLDWRTGNPAALEALTPVIYSELRKLASYSMRGAREGHTLQPTALINEAYLRLLSGKLPDFNGRAHFFAFSARIMRTVLVDSFRARQAAKRGSGNQVPFSETMTVEAGGAHEDFLALHEAMDRLSKFDARKGKVIELRYFGGLTREEIAEALQLTLATVKRDLSLGEGWLRRELRTGTQATASKQTPQHLPSPAPSTDL